MIRRSAQVVQPSEGSDLTIFAVALALGLAGMLFAFSPLFLDLTPSSLASDLLLSLALALFLWGVLCAVSEYKEFGKVFQHEGWQDLFITLLLSLPPAVLFGLVSVLRLPSWLELFVSATALLLSLPVCLGIGATLDAFLIKPRLRPARKRATAPQGPSVAGILGATAALITWGLSNVASLLTITEQLFPGK